MNIVGTLVCIHRFEIGEVAHDADRGGNPIAGSRRQGIFRSNFERVWIERYQRLVAGGAGAAGCPLGVPKKRKKSDFGLMTIRVSPPFKPVS